jgi:cytosine/adenosine deaminase-related metal-dependent hydrolase
VTIINADYILTCDENFKIFKNFAIAFDEEIKAIDELDILKQSYHDAKIINSKPNTILMPGLINIHTHLEFSANKTTLKYGDFIEWLNSVIKHRDELSSCCDESYIDDVLQDILKSGTTTIGAISSFGTDLSSCVKSPLNVIYFNEVLGSNPAAVDVLYGDFLERLNISRKHECDSFTPAISLHSPYSTHPILARKALGIAKDSNMIVSTHFMESDAEREWIDKGEGDFVEFFAPFSPNAKPVNSASDYIDLFKDQKILFTHATKASDKEIQKMNELGSITHSPISNRLLGNGRLDIDKVKLLTLGTDGLSSNSSLNMWDEMRASLMMHHDSDLNFLSTTLLKAATFNAAKIMGKDSGTLEIGYDSDIVAIELPDKIANIEDIAIHLILHTKNADKVFIKGKQQI